MWLNVQWLMPLTIINLNLQESLNIAAKEEFWNNAFWYYRDDVLWALVWWVDHL